MRARAGTHVVEFALLMPVFVVIVFGVFEYGWAWFVRAGVVDAVREGCRAGVVVHPDGDIDGTPESVAEEVALQALADLYIDCGADSDLNCSFTFERQGSSPEETLTCRFSMNYDPIVGLSRIGVPEVLATETTMLFELQR